MNPYFLKPTSFMNTANLKNALPTGLPYVAHILVAEDNIVNRMMVCAMLEKAGYKVTATDTALSAMIALYSNQDIDLVLMDGHLPDMDGFEATRFIRQEEKLGKIRKIPILALTALSMKEDRDRCFQAGMDDFLAKPVKKDDLLAMLQKWLDGHNGSTAKSTIQNFNIDFENIELFEAADSHKLRQELGNDYIPFIKTYFKDSADRISQMIQLLTFDQNWALIQLHAHSLGSSSSYAGATRMAAIACAMEMQLSNDQTEKAKSLFSNLQRCFEETCLVFMKDIPNRERTSQPAAKTAANL
jgi:CheY-like chemotaxis protein/HPt (histidine-containing phosphotransfer) domain-containing protein